jgi:NodT family efflux transporter outer membrane factor (OMF) lipoprotein
MGQRLSKWGPPQLGSWISGGQITRSQESDLANLNVSRAAWGAARISLDANVASTYCNMRAQEQRLEVARSNLKAQTENTRIAEARYRLGSTSELDWQQSRTQLAQTQAQIPVLAYALAQYQHALSVLLGEPPDFVARNYSVVGYLPDAPQQALMVGAPKDLLRRRPDVLQAQYAAAAQSARIGQAEAALYPSFTLTGSFGYATTDASSLFSWDSRALAAGLGFNLPIFDRGKLKAQVRVQDILFNQSVLAYQNQVLKAQQEVEDALAALQANQQQLQDWRMADQAAARSTKLAMVRFISGQTDFTTVSSAEQAHLQTSDAVVQAQAGVLQAIISAYRALGGGWTGDLIQQQSTK